MGKHRDTAAASALKKNKERSEGERGRRMCPSAIERNALPSSVIGLNWLLKSHPEMILLLVSLSLVLL